MTLDQSHNGHRTMKSFDLLAPYSCSHRCYIIDLIKSMCYI